MKITDIITEAANPAQQAAIAVSMKKAGKKPKQGVAEGSLNEFAPGSSDGGGDDDDDSLFNYAKMWYNGDLKTQQQVEKALQKSGLDIGENEDENGGAYISDMSGDYYESWTAEDLGQGVAEGYDDEERPIQDDGNEGRPGKQRYPGKLPKKGQGVAEHTELAEEFDLIESIVEMIAEHNGVDADVVWADLESLTEDELYVFAVTSDPLMEDWQKANKRDKTDGMSQKAVNAYRRENPGSKLKTAVTTKPSKLKKGGKASKRRKSYCSRSRGQMKMHSISCAKTPDKAICKARRRWNC